MTWTLFYIISAVLAGSVLAFLQWWDMTHPLNQYGHPKPKEDTRLTLKDLLIGIGLTICPGVNSLVAAGCLIYAFSEIAPKIVLFGDKR